MLFNERVAQLQRESAHIRSGNLMPFEAISKEDAGGHALDPGERIVNTRGDGRRDWNKRVKEFACFMADVLAGERPTWQLRESMTTADFPNLFGDTLYRTLLGNYKAWPTTYTQWMRRENVNDFRSLHIYALDGGQGLLGGAAGAGSTTAAPAAIKEREPYPEIKLTETPRVNDLVLGARPVARYLSSCDSDYVLQPRSVHVH